MRGAIGPLNLHVRASSTVLLILIVVVAAGDGAMLSMFFDIFDFFFWFLTALRPSKLWNAAYVLEVVIRWTLCAAFTRDMLYILHSACCAGATFLCLGQVSLDARNYRHRLFPGGYFFLIQNNNEKSAARKYLLTGN